MEIDDILKRLEYESFKEKKDIVDQIIDEYLLKNFSGENSETLERRHKSLRKFVESQDK